MMGFLMAVYLFFKKMSILISEFLEIRQNICLFCTKLRACALDMAVRKALEERARAQARKNG